VKLVSGAPPAAEPERSPRSSRILRWVVVSAVLALVGVVGVILYHGHTARPGWVGASNKEFWDYLDLLIVPAAIAVGATFINWMQNERARKAEDAQKERELVVEEQRAQDEALQAYLDQMSQLLTDKERPLGRAHPGDNLSTVARAQTLTALTRLDAGRKRSVLQFLYESGLVIKDHLVVDLWGADLSKAYLSAANLHKVSLSEANLSGADLSAAILRDADLRDANLSAAILSGADLRKANLGAANLSLAVLREADLRDAIGVSIQQTEQAESLEGATLPNEKKYEEWLKNKEGRGEDGKNSGLS
jgi:uncharacterized protein YjbI with pentapeptide repeats